MKIKVREFIGAVLYRTIGLKNSIKLYYFIKLKRIPNLDNPVRFSEKIQRRKWKFDNPLYSQLADKKGVRDYVKEKVGEEILIPIYFAKSKIEVKDLKKLPNSFVLKTNNASGTNIIVKDKKKENLQELVNKMNKFVKCKFWYRTFELFYKKIEPLIIAEQFLETDDGYVPNDYKFHVFNSGGEHRVIIQADHGRFTEKHDRAYFDEEWNMLDFNNGKDFETYDFKFKKPKNFKKMLDIVYKLSEDFDYVRIDLYNDNGKIYFGEITFTDGSGLDPFEPDEADYVWGGYWK